jgi:hypothetical protein
VRDHGVEEETRAPAASGEWSRESEGRGAAVLCAGRRLRRVGRRRGGAVRRPFISSRVKMADFIDRENSLFSALTSLFD